MGDTILRVDDIQKFYGNKGNLTKAIDHISFSVRKGEFLGIMGASGSGKTTLLNCISTIDTVTSGHIYVEEKDITALHGAQLADFRGKKLGFIFQNFNLLDTLTAYENISLALSIAGAKPSEIEQRIPQIAQALNIQDVLGKYPYQNLLNCNYNGTYRYVAAALQSHPEITVGGATLQRAEDKVLQETYIMTSVGNNDRGTLIVPDSVTASLEKDVNALLVQYEPNADSNEILQKMIPIGLDSTHGYRYAEKNMMYETFYGLDALVSFLCCYIGLVFLLICAALLALKQLTETTDNVYRYGLLQKLGAGRRQIDHTLFVQTVVFFAIPLIVAGVYSAFLIGKAMAVVEEFMNIHIATNIGLTIVLFLLVYGGYFLATYLSCKRIVTEQREVEV